LLILRELKSRSAVRSPAIFPDGLAAELAVLVGHRF
jgi:hypothetical protein